MASLTRQKNGSWLLQFTGADKARRSIRFPKCSEKAANSFRFRIETILACRLTGEALDRDTSEWLRDLPALIHERIAKVGLVEGRKRELLGPFLRNYVEMRSDLADSTKAAIGTSINRLLQYFGDNKPLDAITEADAERWLLWLRRERAENTARKTIRNAKMMFRFAMKQGLVSSNPFVDLKGATIRSDDRRVFVEREKIAQVLGEVKDPRKRLLIALARYGGLRIPSELVGLKWTEVNWERATFVIHSPKTSRYGKETRVCPIFPELLPFFDAAWDVAQKGVDRIFPDIRGSDQNLRTWFERLILRAGMLPWPKVWQNLRATRATELANEFPSHVCCSWLGHSEAIADANYRMTTGQHIDAATRKPTGPLITPENVGSGNGALQKALRSGTVLDGTHQRGPKKTKRFSRLCPPILSCTSVQVGDDGLEPPTSTV